MSDLTIKEGSHLALNMLATNYITPREMELALAKSYLALVNKLKLAEAVMDAAGELIYMTDDGLDRVDFYSFSLQPMITALKAYEEANE